MQYPSNEAGRRADSTSIVVDWSQLFPRATRIASASNAAIRSILSSDRYAASYFLSMSRRK